VAVAEFSKTRVILLSGEDFQRSERLSKILSLVVDKNTRDFNFDELNPNTFSVNLLSEIITTYPVLSDKRVILVRDFDKINPDIRKKAALVIKNVQDSALIIIEGEEASLSPKPPAEYFVSETFKPVYESQLPQWIQSRFSIRGKKVTKLATALLINNAGTVLREIDNEIEKISIAFDKKETVTEKEVEHIVGSFRQDTIWNLCNSLGTGDLAATHRILANLMDSEKNKETFFIVSMASHIMKISEYNSLIKKGGNPAEAMKVLSSSPFLWKINRYDKQTSNITPQKARKIIEALKIADSTMKKYGLNKELFMELLVPAISPEN
jgi:DNA polymerase III subunit delta